MSMDLPQSAPGGPNAIWCSLLFGLLCADVLKSLAVKGPVLAILFNSDCRAFGFVATESHTID